MAAILSRGRWVNGTVFCCMCSAHIALSFCSWCPKVNWSKWEASCVYGVISLVLLNLFGVNIKICSNFLPFFSGLLWCSYLQLEDKDLFMPYFQYNGWWWPGDASGQVIGSHGIDLVNLEYSGFGTRRVFLMLMPQGNLMFWRVCFALRWMPLNLTYEKSALVQVMARSRKATRHYLSQCWPISMMPYGITTSQWIYRGWWDGSPPFWNSTKISYPYIERYMIYSDVKI